MSEFVVYRGEFLGGTFRAVLTISARGAHTQWEPHEPHSLKGDVCEQFEAEFHAWWESCAIDYRQRIGRNTLVFNDVVVEGEGKDAPD